MTDIQRPFAPVADKSTTTGADAAKDKPCTKYRFTRAVLLQLQNLTRVKFEIGVQDVPNEILAVPHQKQWLENNGARPYVPEAAKPKPEPAFIMPKITDHHVRFLQSIGYPQIKTVENAQKFVDFMKPADVPGFFAQAAAWKGPVSNDTIGQAPTANTAAEDKKSGDAGKPAEDANGKPADDAKESDKPADDKAISAGAGASTDVTNNSKAAADADDKSKAEPDAGKAAGRRK